MSRAFNFFCKFKGVFGSIIVSRTYVCVLTIELISVCYIVYIKIWLHKHVYLVDNAFIILYQNTTVF